MKMKTSELIGPALDCAVAKCEGLQPLHHYTFDKGHHIVPPPYWEDYDYGFAPSTDWAQAGPIIEREKIDVAYAPEDNGENWYANMYWRGADCVPGYPPGETFRCGADGATPLIAAMRCYVASKMGDEVETHEGGSFHD